MGSLLKSKKDKALLAKWNAKLAKAGFIDAEDQGHEDPKLRAWSSDFERPRTVRRYEATQSHFLSATHFLTTHRFESKAEKSIWTMYADGVTVREIAERLKLKRTKVHDTIVRLRLEMQLGKPV